MNRTSFFKILLFLPFAASHLPLRYEHHAVTKRFKVAVFKPGTFWITKQQLEDMPSLTVNNFRVLHYDHDLQRYLVRIN